MKRLCLIVLVLSFTFTTPGMAMDNDDSYNIMGAISCGDWSKSRGGAEDMRRAVYYNWIFGYVTAFNRRTPDVYGILGSTDNESVYLWMDKYCHENPLNNLAGGWIFSRPNSGQIASEQQMTNSPHIVN